MGSGFSWAGLKQRPAQPLSAVRPSEYVKFRTSVNYVQQSFWRFEYKGRTAASWDDGDSDEKTVRTKWICGMDDKEEVVQDSDDIQEQIVEDESEDEGADAKVPKGPELPSARAVSTPSKIPESSVIAVWARGGRLDSEVRQMTSCR